MVEQRLEGAPEVLFRLLRQRALLSHQSLQRSPVSDRVGCLISIVVVQRSTGSHQVLHVKQLGRAPCSEGQTVEGLSQLGPELLLPAKSLFGLLISVEDACWRSLVDAVLVGNNPCGLDRYIT